MEVVEIGGDSGREESSGGAAVLAVDCAGADEVTVDAEAKEAAVEDETTVVVDVSDAVSEVLLESPPVNDLPQ